MRKFGLIGHPIEHSLSPALFKAGYDGRYTYDLIETADFEEAYERFLKEYDGINVTAPFKEQALQKADILSEECRMVGATNLLIKTPQGITAYNSDFRGLRLLLYGLEADEKSFFHPLPDHIVIAEAP
jgi:shikimate dehydrogenase